MIENLTLETFKEKIFDFETNKDWTFKGELPAIVKFTAIWCSPCKTLNPILQELSKEYVDKIKIYEIDVDQEPELSTLFNIRSVPAMLFCTNTNKPSMKVGALPKSKIIDAINNNLLT